MKKMLFIMNPYSGQRRANRYLTDIISLFNKAGYSVTVHMTQGQGDARNQAARHGGEYDLVVCCGGDGTFNEVLSGLLLSQTDVPIGYIPSGSTNDFANSLKLSVNPVEAAQDIVDGEPVCYDAGKFGDRYFSYVASFGAFTRASYATPQDVKNMLGHAAYVLEGISELSQIHNEHIRMEIDGEPVEGDYIFGAISNSTSVGGILTLDPEVVDMCDGLLEVLLVRMPNSLAEIAECIEAVQTQKYNCEMITFRSGKSIRVKADPNMEWTLDGEWEPGHREVEIQNCHKAFRLMQVKKDA